MLKAIFFLFRRMVEKNIRWKRDYGGFPREGNREPVTELRIQVIIEKKDVLNFKCEFNKRLIEFTKVKTKKEASEVRRTEYHILI